MVYPKSLRKEEQKIINQKRSDNVRARWNVLKNANQAIGEGVAKALLKPPTRRRSKLFYYIGYIYLPVGFLILLPSMLFLNQVVISGIIILWALGYFALMHLDDKLMERDNENERFHNKNK